MSNISLTKNTSPRKPAVARLCMEVLSRETRPMHLSRLHAYVNHVRPDTKYSDIAAILKDDARFVMTGRSTWGLKTWDTETLTGIKYTARSKPVRSAHPPGHVIVQLCLDILAREKRPLHLSRLLEHVTQHSPGVKCGRLRHNVTGDARFKQVGPNAWGLAMWDATRLSDFTLAAPPPRKVRAVPTVAPLCMEALVRENRPMHTSRLFEYVARTLPAIKRASICGAVTHDALFKKVAHGVWGLATWDAARLSDFTLAAPPSRKRARTAPTVAQLCVDALNRENRPLHVDRLHDYVTQHRPGSTCNTIRTRIRYDAHFKRVGPNIWGLATWDAARLMNFTLKAPLPRKKAQAVPSVAQLCLEAICRENHPLHKKHLHEYVVRIRPEIKVESLPTCIENDARFKRVAQSTWGLATWEAGRPADSARPAVLPEKKARPVPAETQLCVDILGRENRPLHFSRLFEHARLISPGIRRRHTWRCVESDARFTNVGRGVWGLAAWDAARLADFTLATPLPRKMTRAAPTAAQLCEDVLGRENRPLHFSRLMELVALIRPEIRRGSVHGSLSTDERFKNVGSNIWGLAAWDAARLADLTHAASLPRKTREHQHASCLVAR